MISRPGSSQYCRLSVVAQASTEVEEAIPTEALLPYKDHFFPPFRENREAPMAAANIYPLRDPVRFYLALGNVEHTDLFKVISRGLQDNTIVYEVRHSLSIS